MVAFEVSIAILNHIADSRLVLLHNCGHGRPSKSQPSGPRRSSPSSRAIDNTVRGFARGASPPLASREFKRYFTGRTSRSMMVGIPAPEQRQEKPMNDVVTPVWNGIDFKAEAHRDPWSVPLDEIDVSNPYLYSEDTWHGFFARLRGDDPVHFSNSPLYGPYWSVTRYRDIMTVDTSHQTYSSDAAFGGITLKDLPLEYRKESFIAMDPPRHDEQRKIVAPIVAPPNLAKMSSTIRERAIRILEGLPRGEVFDWVDRVSIELTTQMLSTLFDFPFEERRTLTRWSNVSTVNTRAGTEIDSEEKRDAVLQEMLAYFAEVWKIRQKQPPKFDLISMLAHGEATRDLPSRPQEFMGNLLLLIVGGNDTTRNSISGGLWFLNQFPEEYAKLRADPGLIPKMVPEIIRYQSPVVHMRRTALCDAELNGKRIHKGEKVAMWYIAGNRDPEEIEDPDRFIIDRARPRQHLSFGFGIHRCVGNRLAEMQLTILWEEILKRFPPIEVVEKPKRAYSNLIHGITEMKVRIPA
jgi:cytochrome P450